ncbi:MAG: shikimate kinase [Clostridiales bacterium]|nr:shikimate kinase [Clostridiales bacterium]
MNIVLCGFMGAGKTTVGKEIAEITGRKFVDTDELIEKKQHKSISDIFKEFGEDYFRNAEYEICREAAEMENAVISTGGGAVTFERNTEALKKGGKIVFLDASFGAVCSRIGNDSSRPLFKNKENAEKLYNERRNKYLQASDIIINADKPAVKSAAEIADMFK